jgi:lipoate-protein ligase A
MAVDQALLESVQSDQLPYLRLYQWIEPTISLGYFQQFVDREQHPGSLSCPVVRRTTGGGAICHDQEITYSLVIPVSQLPSQNCQHLYTLVHQTIIDQLQQHDIQGELRCLTDPVTASQQPFLCFQRKAEGDILINSQKVAGSAQRRQHGVVLQHGSLLLSGSPLAPEVAGITQLTGIKLSAQIWLQEWPQRLAQALGWKLTNAILGEEQEKRASQIQEERFGCANWTKRR